MTTQSECPEDLVSALVQRLQSDEDGGFAELERLNEDYAGDARLHFLRGSLLAGRRRYGEAREAMRRAVELAPGYHIARFQAGFLDFTSGDVASALGLWAPLGALDEHHPLRLFAEGLTLAAQDQIEPALAALGEGMRRNQEIPPLNRDIQLIVSRLTEQPPPEPETTSTTHHLLKQYAKPGTRH